MLPEAEQGQPAAAAPCPQYPSPKIPGCFFKKPFLLCLLGRGHTDRSVLAPWACPDLSAFSCGQPLCVHGCPGSPCLLLQLGRQFVRDIINSRTFKGCFKSPLRECCLAEILWLRLSLHLPREQQDLGVRLLACCCHTWACTELFLGAETSEFVLSASHSL